MGDPKKPKKTYVTPRNPWDSTRLFEELEIIGAYGLKNKRELWKASTVISKIRRQARMLLRMPTDLRATQEKALISRLYQMGLLEEGELNLDNILNLKVQNLLDRRLQTLIWKKGLAKTVNQARQLVVHGKVSINGRIVNRPGYLVSRDEEGSISLVS